MHETAARRRLAAFGMALGVTGLIVAFVHHVSPTAREFETHGPAIIVAFGILTALAIQYRERPRSSPLSLLLSLMLAGGVFEYFVAPHLPRPREPTLDELFDELYAETSRIQTAKFLAIIERDAASKIPQR